MPSSGHRRDFGWSRVATALLVGSAVLTLSPDGEIRPAVAAALAFAVAAVAVVAWAIRLWECQPELYSELTRKPWATRLTKSHSLNSRRSRLVVWPSHWLKCDS